MFSKHFIAGVVLFKGTATPNIYTYCHTLSQPDALPILAASMAADRPTDQAASSVGIRAMISASVTACTRRSKLRFVFTHISGVVPVSLPIRSAKIGRAHA